MRSSHPPDTTRTSGFPEEVLDHFAGSEKPADTTNHPSSPDLIGTVTDAGQAELVAWQAGPEVDVMVASWRRACTHVIPFFAFPRPAAFVYTTNALESVHAQRRKIIKTRGHVPNDERRRSCCGSPGQHHQELAWRNITKKWIVAPITGSLLPFVPVSPFPRL